jgi:hypothetical protein
MSWEMLVISRFLCSIVVSSYIVFSVVCLRVYFKFAICLDSLPWEAKKIIILDFELTAIFCILLFNFGQILKLDGLSFEYCTLHVFNHLLLLFSESIVTKLHLVDFFSHRDDLSLTNCWIKWVLHIFLKLNFAFPQKNLSFSLNNFRKYLSLLFLKLWNLVLKFYTLIFKFFEFLLELIFDVLIVVE